MADTQTNDRVRVDCPSCEKQLKVPASAAGKVAKCPACGEKVRIPEASPASRPRSQPASSPTPPPAVKPDTEEMATAGDTTVSHSPPAESGPRRQVYQSSAPSGGASGSGGLKGFATSSPRLVLNTIYVLLRFGLPLFLLRTSVATETMAYGLFGLFLFFVPRIPYFVAERIAALLISAIRCPGCGFEQDAIGCWTIGSFTDHKERHIYTAKNPIDKGVCGQTDCPQCGATIRVR